MARAIETLRPARERLFQDPYALELVDAGLLRAVLRSTRFPPARRLVLAAWERRFPGTMAGLATRTRFLDDAVEQSAAAGTGQFVLLGAGLDSRAHRLPALRDAAVFEVDRAPTLGAKRERLAARGRATATRDVALDLERDPLSPALREAGLDASRPVFFLWEGVTQYLGADAVEETLEALRGLAASGSTLAFTYVRRAALEGGGVASARAAASGGEPWRFAIDPEELGTFLRRFGLGLVEDAGGDEMRERYLAPLGRAEPIWSTERCAVARWA